jgi:hypothetical protein
VLVARRASPRRLNRETPIAQADLHSKSSVLNVHPSLV